jgi:hypothetical protein
MFYSKIIFFIKQSFKFWNEHLWRYEIEVWKIFIIIVGYDNDGTLTPNLGVLELVLPCIYAWYDPMFLDILWSR